jgi:hypothetical protein
VRPERWNGPTEVPKTVASFLALDEVGPFLAATHVQ